MDDVVSISSLHPEIKPKYPGHERCQFTLITLFGAEASALVVAEWSRGNKVPPIHTLYQTRGIQRELNKVEIVEQLNLTKDQ